MTIAARQDNGDNTFRGFLRRLAKDQAGNTMAMVAAAVVPMMAMVGGGVDATRAYMAQTRLQQACDSGALATRRSMSGSTPSTADITEGYKFFDFNFPSTSLGVTARTRTYAAGSETGVVQGTATATLPMSVMKVFGYTNLTLAVSCSSKLDVGNTDVMMVLDTTGSMSTLVSDGSGGTLTRLAAMRLAVKDFYDALGPGSTSSGRIRYGFVPYGRTVNVGYMLPSSYLVGGTSGETWNYQSRRPRYRRYDAGTPTNATTTTGPSAVNTTQTYSSNLTGANCVIYGNNGAAYGTSPFGTPNTSSSTGSPVTGGSQAGGSTTSAVTTTTTTTSYAFLSHNGNTTPNPPTSTSARSCRRTRTVSTSTSTVTTTTPWTASYVYVATTGYTFLDWSYQQVAQTVSGYITGVATQDPTETSTSTNTWAGCIEERDTVNTITTATSTTSVPTGAYDLDLTLIPSSTATKWRPYWPEVMYSRSSTPATSGTQLSGACPARARFLSEYATYDSVSENNSTTASVDESAQPTLRSYIDNITQASGTIHDIGIIWGARLLAGSGIMSSQNTTAPNGLTISRHLVFMTDGSMNAHNTEYVFGGYNALDGRLAPTGSSSATMDDIHNQRTLIACQQAKNLGITIWVVAFAEGVASDYPELQACATSADHFTFSSDSASLRSTFQDIATSIGGLRLSQ